MMVSSSGLDGLSPVLGASGTTASPETIASQIRKTPESFLGPNSNLVNLDALVSTKNAGSKFFLFFVDRRLPLTILYSQIQVYRQEVILLLDQRSEYRILFRLQSQQLRR